MKIGGRMSIETKEVIDIERDVFVSSVSPFHSAPMKR